jgi:hypothetical protein
MPLSNGISDSSRYAVVPEEKSGGVTYTPKILADFVAGKMVEIFDDHSSSQSIRILDPAVGDGELLISLLQQLTCRSSLNIQVCGFDTDKVALKIAVDRLRKSFPDVSVDFEAVSFLQFVLENFGIDGNRSLFSPPVSESYDLIIANPPYVRTQIMGGAQSQILAKQFGLSGRLDLYYAFLLGIAQVLKPSGVAGIIVSNRFMTTRSGASVRKAVLERFNILHIWDLGDTKLFNAAVLPAVLLVKGKNKHNQEKPIFSSIYETSEPTDNLKANPIKALACEGVVEIFDGRRFHVQHGRLDVGGTPGDVWRIATSSVDAWLSTVKAHSWCLFSDIGNIRVGVKTCADKVFIRNDWEDMPDNSRPELLKPLTTHHNARRFKSLSISPQRQIIYPHEVVQGLRRPVDILQYPRSLAYFEAHRQALEKRKYVIDAGRKWYEIWVPHDPRAWSLPKLVFRDIAEKPTFWIDLDGSVINGDCYWLICKNPDQKDLLWLAAAVGNSTFIECFYDYSFQNKLYSGRRRFITQYVEKFPLPDPQSSLAQAIIATAKRIYRCVPSSKADQLQKHLDEMVWKAFGLVVKKASGQGNL